MVTADFTESTTVAPPDSAAVSPNPSDERVNPTPEETPGDTAAPVDGGAPAQETDEPAAPTTPSAPSYDFDALESRLDAIARGDDDAQPLSKEEAKALARHQQSRIDSQRAQAQANYDYQQNQQRLRNLTASLPNDLQQIALETSQALVRMGLTPDSDEARPLIELMQRKQVDRLSSTFKDIEPIVLQPWSAAVLSVVPDWDPAITPTKLQELQRQPLDKQVMHVVKAAYEKGQRESTDGKKLAAVQAKLDAANAELEKVAGKRQAGAGTVGTSGASASSGRSFANLGDLSRAFNSNEIDRTHYGSEYRRLTGRDIGDR